VRRRRQDRRRYRATFLRSAGGLAAGDRSAAPVALQAQAFDDGFDIGRSHAHFHCRFGRRGSLVKSLKQRQLGDSVSFGG